MTQQSIYIFITIITIIASYIIITNSKTKRNKMEIVDNVVDDELKKYYDMEYSKNIVYFKLNKHIAPSKLFDQICKELHAIQQPKVKVIIDAKSFYGDTENRYMVLFIKKYLIYDAEFGLSHLKPKEHSTFLEMSHMYV